MPPVFAPGQRVTVQSRNLLAQADRLSGLGQHGTESIVFRKFIRKRRPSADTREIAAAHEIVPMSLRYVGLIGPRKRHQLMNHLLDLGITVNAGFFAPAGLDLGAETPEEIALSIFAEVQRVFATGSGKSLRERKISIHTALERVNTSALLKR